MSILSQKYKDMQFIQGGKQSKWDRLYNWLNDMRYGIAPDENTPDDERREREAQVDVIDDIMEWIEKHPQEPKTGHWIEKDGFDGDVYYDCSECGESWTTIEGTPWDNEWNYCPNCGARMTEGE